MQPPRTRRTSPRTPGSTGSRRRRKQRLNRKLLLWIGGCVAGVVLLPVLVIGILIALIDPATYKARIQAAALQSFGRELVIRGNVSVSASLSPTLIADDVSLANFATGSRADMIRVDQMEVQLSPSALLAGRFLIVRLVLLHPDILIETDASGEGNWRFNRRAPVAGAATPPPAPAPTAPAAPATTAAAAPPRQAGPPPALALQTLHIRDGRLTWRNGQTGRSTVYEVKRVSATATSADSPVVMGAEIGIGRQRLLMSGQTGPLSRLQDVASQAPWGLFMNLDLSGAKLTVAGSLTKPLEGRGYSLRVDGAIRDLLPLSWLSPVELPPLHNLTFTAKLLDQGGPLPDISSVVIQAGLTNLDKISPGFTLETARIEMPRLSEPVVATVEGQFAGAPMRLNATIGAPALLLPGNKSSQAFAIDASAEAGGANVAIRGAILDPAKLGRMDIAIGARVADLSILSPLAGQPLPALKTIAFTTHLVDVPAGDAPVGEVPGAMLKGIILTLPQGDLSGDATLLLGARPSVQASFESARIDVDALLAILSAPARENQQAQLNREPRPEDVTAPPKLPRRGNAVVPDDPLPLAGLSRGDADLQMSVGELALGGAIYRNLAGHAALRGGGLVLDPFHLEVPGGRVDLRASVDSAQVAAPMALSLRAPGLDLKPLLAAFGVGDLATGKLLAEADLRAAGRSLHALAATLDGKLGIGLTDADIDNGVAGDLLRDVLRAARLPQPAADSGTLKLRCVVLRADIAQGVATLGPAVLDGPKALLNVTGRANLGEETLALQLRPMLRSGPGIVVPLRVEGSFKQPVFALDSGSALQSALASVVGRNGPAAFPGEHGGDSCTLALASVRGLVPPLSSAIAAPAAVAASANAAPAAVPATR